MSGHKAQGSGAKANTATSGLQLLPPPPSPLAPMKSRMETSGTG